MRLIRRSEGPKRQLTLLFAQIRCSALRTTHVWLLLAQGRVAWREGCTRYLCKSYSLVKQQSEFWTACSQAPAKMACEGILDPVRRSLPSAADSAEPEKSCAVLCVQRSAGFSLPCSTKEQKPERKATERRPRHHRRQEASVRHHASGKLLLGMFGGKLRSSASFALACYRAAEGAGVRGVQQTGSRSCSSSLLPLAAGSCFGSASL